MHEVEVRSRIRAPRERVFEVYTDHLSWNEWARIGRVRLEREGTPRPNGVGCVRVISANGISVYEEVVEFQRPTRMRYRVVRGGLPVRDHLGTVEFLDDNGGTQVVWSCRFESKIPGLGILWRAIIAKVFRDTLRGLERYPFEARG